jgi:RNA polymerase sigma factor (TIGR02999 family)
MAAGPRSATLHEVDIPATTSWEVRRLAAHLLPDAYEQLKRIARRVRGRASSEASIQTTVLVHESYLRLCASSGFVDNAHFLRASALAMRHALINFAESRLAQKRGSGSLHVTLSHAEDFSVDSDEGLLELNDALRKLAEADPRLAEVVECRYFAGYDEADTARALNVSIRTVRRDWTKARAWLFRELRGGAPG